MMPPRPPTDASPPVTRPWWRSPWFRWPLRLLLWSAVLLAGLIVLVLSQWPYRVQYFNEYSADLLPAGQTLTCQELDLDWATGTLEIGGLHYRSEEKNLTTEIKAKTARVIATHAQLLSGRVEELTLHEVSHQTLFTDTPTAAEKSSHPHDSAPPEKPRHLFQAGKINVDQLQLHLQLPGQTSLRGQFQLRGNDFTVFSDGQISTSVGHFSYAQLHFTTPGLVFASPSGQLSGTIDTPAQNYRLRELALQPSALTITQEFWEKMTAAVESSPPTASSSPPPLSLVLEKASLPQLDLRLELPAQAGTITSGLSIDIHNWQHSIHSAPSGQATFRSDELAWHLNDTTSPVRWSSLVLALQPYQTSQYDLASLTLDQPQIKLDLTTRQTIEKLQSWFTQKFPPSAETTAPLFHRCHTAQIQQGSLHCDAALFHPQQPQIQTQLDLSLNELPFDPSALRHVTAAQHLNLRELTIGQAQKDTPALLTTPQLQLAITPQSWFTRRFIDSLHITAPVVSINSELFSTEQSAPSSEKSAPTSSAFPQFGQLRVTDGQWRADNLAAHLPATEGTWSIETHEQNYHLKVQNLSLREPSSARAATSLPPRALGQIHSFTAVIDPTQLAEKKIPSLKLEGGSFECGEAFERLLKQQPTVATPAEKSQITEDTTPWRIGSVSVRGVNVLIPRLVPFMDPIILPLDLPTLPDLELTADGFRRQTQVQRFEIGRVRLNSTYGQSIASPVATFDTVFIYASLADLMDKQIQRVEVLSPEIFIGDQLFYYVDHFRKLAEAKPSPKNTKIASTNNDDALVIATTQTEKKPSTDKGWNVDRIEASYGKLRLALRGSKIDALPPLPFRCSTKINEGKVDLTLDIPKGTYRPSTQLPLEIDVLEGSALFNLPLKNRDNNLFQFFRASELRYDKFSLQDVYLKITYDQRGVYCEFGGLLYGGQLSGGFYLYLNDLVTWEMWLDAQKVRLSPLTERLTPEYLIMDSIVSFKAAAFGDMNSFYTASGELQTHTPGTMTIKALNSLLKDLPPEWKNLERSLTTIGLETLRDYSFDTCTGQFKLYGREGSLVLNLNGAHGQRAFNVKVHDYQQP